MAMSAMQRGLHVYVQKPLCHDIFEVRRLTEVARDRKLISQMGIQIHSDAVYRLGVRLIQDGTIGKIREVHLQHGPLRARRPPPDRKDPVPASLNWDWWIGVAPHVQLPGRVLSPLRMASPARLRHRHSRRYGLPHFDPSIEALALTAPTSVRSEGAAPGQHNWAVDSTIHYVFPGTRFTDGNTFDSPGTTATNGPPGGAGLARIAQDPEPGFDFRGHQGRRCCCRTSADRCSSRSRISAISASHGSKGPTTSINGSTPFWARAGPRPRSPIPARSRKPCCWAPGHAFPRRPSSGTRPSSLPQIRRGDAVCAADVSQGLGSQRAHG